MQQAKSSKRYILILGALTPIGQLLTGELLQLPQVNVRALVSDSGGRQTRKRFHHQVGLVEYVPGCELESLAEACRGVFTIIPIQLPVAPMELLRVAEKQGVSRLLSVREPLDGSGIFPAPNWEAIWGRHASTLRMRLVQIHSGCCPENFLQEGLPGILDWKRGNLALWGKGNAPMDFTTSHDKARYLAQIATRDFVAPHIRIAGSSLNIWECKDMFEGICGRELRVVQQGSLRDLDLEIARRQELSPESPSEWSALLQWRYLLRNPHGSLNLLNHQFPEIRPKPLHHVLRAYRQTLVT